MLTIAVQPDLIVLEHDPRQSFSERWLERLPARGHAALAVDASRPDFFDQITGCDGFMWWLPPVFHPRELARRIIMTLSHVSDITPFPDWKSAWHFDDKASQSYLLRAAGIPTPRTWVFWKWNEAEEFCRQAEYPLVIKLSSGVCSQNVALLRSEADARFQLRRLFQGGIQRLEDAPSTRVGRARRSARESLRALHRLGRPEGGGGDFHRNYVLLQEFLEGNDFDLRVTIIGDRAFGVRRANRVGDFRASGSGQEDRNPEAVPEDAIRLAFRAARALEAPTLAVDVLRRAGEPVLGEVSYFFPRYGINAVAGHWKLAGDPERGALCWVEGQARAEDLILDDYLERLRAGRSQARGIG